MIEVTHDLKTVLAIRRTVFIEEQGISVEDDVDGRDREAVQLVAFEGDRAVGTARILLSGDGGKIGRVAVLRDMRGRGLGKALICFALDELRRRQVSRAMLNAQSNAIRFYEDLGFTAFGPEFLDAGIPHREMVQEL